MTQRSNVPSDMDDPLNAALTGWADGDVAPRPGFLAEMSAIPAEHVQDKPKSSAHIAPARGIFEVLGGWRLLGPQLAGVIVAGWLGITTGAAANASDDAVYDAVLEEYSSAASAYLANETVLDALSAEVETDGSALLQ